LIVAGGSYIEFCQYPYWKRLFGSGLRAALALQHLSPGTELHTYAPSAYAGEVLATLSGAGLVGTVASANEPMRFEWLHPYELLAFPDPSMQQLEMLQVAGPAVLRFGMLEGTARVAAERVVYSQQNETEGFFHNGSRAKELVIVISERELARMLPDGRTSDDRIAQLFEHTDYIRLRRFAVLLRNELGDVVLCQRGGASTPIKSYAAESYFKIGSGDVLAAAFAHAWLEDGLALEAAADRAARSLAWFIQDARLPLPDERELPRRVASSLISKVRILGSETLEMGQLVTTTIDWLERQGVEALPDSSSHGSTRAAGAPTLVLVGARATARDIQDLVRASFNAHPRVVFSNGIEGLDAYFPGARMVSDYASALYHLVRSEPV
jgi:hypothetical protein